MPNGRVSTAPGTSIFVNTPLSSRNPCGSFERGHVGVVAVRANDLTNVVDPECEGPLGAREIDRGEGLLVLQETMESSSVIGVAADGPAAVVDAESHGERAGAWSVDGSEDAVVRDKPMASDAKIALALAGSRYLAVNRGRNARCHRRRRLPGQRRAGQSERSENNAKKFETLD